MPEVLQFPGEAETIRRAAEAYQRLSPTERFRKLLSLIASGWAIMEHSPRRHRARQLRDEQEAVWQRIQKELFTSHVP